MKKQVPIAVVGLAGIFPGSHNINSFWQNIIDKFDATIDVPSGRWIVKPEMVCDSNPAPDKAFSKRACLITDFVFNPDGYNLDPQLLSELDPLFHLVLQAGKNALENCCSSSLNKKRTGTILAAIALPTDSSSAITRKILGTSFEYRLFNNKPFSDIPISREETLAAKVTSLPAALLAEGLGLGGGSFTLDAACASSIYAVKLACDELQAHRADCMLAGGVSRPECLYTQVGFSQLKALSPSGRCAPFDESADGLVVGEGAGILVLKRLNDALQDQDRIYAIIQGIGLSNDMHGNLLAPESEGQVRAMNKAYQAAGWAPPDVEYIECHGAGTPVGDKIELESLRTLWGPFGWTKGQCSIGSVKSMTGHLLTAAGAAGMIKTLLALQHKILPPSLKFKRPAKNSPLIDSPFRVQTEPENWLKPEKGTPRRAAVSAFGFGGINAHILFEEWIERPENKEPITESLSAYRTEYKGPASPVAIVGMEAAFGSIRSLKEFQEMIFSGQSAIVEKPDQRWKGSDAIVEKLLGKHMDSGAYIDELIIDFLEFHIPPKEIPDILLQQLLMLKVAAGAMQNAGFKTRKDRPNMGTIIGIGFDFEATDFHLRWNLHNEVQKWKKMNFPALTDEDEKNWLIALQDECGPPLTPVRTLGALGGIVASRIAKEFLFGGPSYVVSGEEVSGLRALEIAVRSLQQKESDAYLVGAVDLFGDVRNIVTSDRIQPFSPNRKIHPFDIRAGGSLPGEGAAAVVLKRLEQAIEEGDRIYSIIKGIGGSGGQGIESGSCSETVYSQSLTNAFHNADIIHESISYIETHGSGNPEEDQVETQALHSFFQNQPNACAIGSVMPTIGHTGASSGLASMVKASLCLYQEIIPPLPNYSTPASNLWNAGPFHIPAFAQYWYRNQKDGPRRACVASMTREGTCMHAVLEGFDYQKESKLPEQVVMERKRPVPVVNEPYGLFVVEADETGSLASGLDTLQLHIQNHATSPQHLERAACSWYQDNPLNSDSKLAVSIVLRSHENVEKCIAQAKEQVLSGKTLKSENSYWIGFTPNPLAKTGKIAFLFPGSGNHFVGMGRKIGAQWPDIMRKYDSRTARFKNQAVPDCYMPWTTNWESGWEKKAHENMISDPMNMIFGQVVHGILHADLVRSFGIEPSAVIGYSLGESAGLFATRAWPDPDEMLERMLNTNLFTTELAGPCNAVRRSWNVPENESIDWLVCLINRPADQFLNILNKFPFVRLLIVNTPGQCVIGGVKKEVLKVIESLECEAVFLEGVVAVHCDAALPVAKAYKNLHLFPTTAPENITYYSCALGRSYALTAESAAASIQKQALEGFDFIKTINQAYQDGVRLFLEMGPGASCTGMVSDILGKRPHRAVSASSRSEDSFLTILKFLGTLISERVPVDLGPLYGITTEPVDIIKKTDQSKQQIIRKTGSKAPHPPLPVVARQPYQYDNPETDRFIQDNGHPDPEPNVSAVLQQMKRTMEATDQAHNRFLDFSNELGKTIKTTFALQTQLMDELIKQGKLDDLSDSPSLELPKAEKPLTPDFDEHPVHLDYAEGSSSPVCFSREMCMEFAVGSIEKVLGPEFAVIDSYKARVRLPDEPLMLVDRILAVEGEKCSLGPGMVVTEHDVLADAWYLDGGRAPVCISVEAGQADLFLCSYLGIDHHVKGERTYRLLDATVKFHRGLPVPGETIQYRIHIDKFVKQGDTYLFFFNFEGFINDNLLITMKNGCAGFFTEEEVKNSGGIILTEQENKPEKGKKDENWQDFVLFEKISCTDAELNNLRKGDAAGCFGPLFQGIRITESLWLPDGRMHLIDRILEIDPAGGRYGLGTVKAEADIRPDDWFLTCHFMDDMVMPGTLMYECCAHTLRVFLQRLGWVTDNPATCYEPVIGIESELKCRGPVTPETKHVVYQVDIKEIGYNPEPYVIGDAHMYADGHHIVMFHDMSMKMTHLSRKEIEDYWKKIKLSREKITGKLKSQTKLKNKKVLFDRESIEQFSMGKPSLAFGEPYKIFDDNRFIARLPGPPYLFMDRIVSVEHPPWKLQSGGWVEAEYDVSPDDWYFRADRSGTMPFCVLLEIPLQACGWLAAYAGSALTSKKDLKFRNLGGEAVIHRPVVSEQQTLTMKSRLKNVSKAADMIIEYFGFQVVDHNGLIYEGNTYFGFFTREALLEQVGLRDAEKSAYRPDEREMENSMSFAFEDIPPLTPNDRQHLAEQGLVQPANAIRMIDSITAYVPDGGPANLGYILGTKTVDPDEWFFKAHFFQDPVCPGSLGIESFLQLIRFAAGQKWPDLKKTHRVELITKKQHAWSYRGQIIPANRQIEIEASITDIQEGRTPQILADGLLKVDGLYIYEMKDFGFRLVPVKEN